MECKGSNMIGKRAKEENQHRSSGVGHCSHIQCVSCQILGGVLPRPHTHKHICIQHYFSMFKCSFQLSSFCECCVFVCVSVCARTCSLHHSGLSKDI